MSNVKIKSAMNIISMGLGIVKIVYCYLEVKFFSPIHLAQKIVEL